MSMPSRLLALLGLCLLLVPVGASQCFGTVSRGRIEGSVRLPISGPNFHSYSRLAAAAGRTHVHAQVAASLLAAYAALQDSAPGKHYVYGETGLAQGGRFAPHRTHQNGLSVDFFVPVLNPSGESVALPTAISSRFGYDLEFDAQGRLDTYRIDFPALAEHLYQLHRAAQKQGIGIQQVIIERAYLPALFATPRGAYLRRQLHFMRGKPWVRHDEHYHIDFALPCRPL